MALVVVALDGGLFQGAIHPLDLAIRPRVIGLGQAMLDSVLATSAIEAVDAQHRSWPRAVLRRIAELDTVVGEHGVDLIRHGLDQGAQEIRGRVDVGPLLKLGKGELRGSVDCDEEVELALFGPDLGDIDVEVADRVGGEALPLRPVALNFWQSTDAMPLQASVEGGSRQVWKVG